MCNMSKVIEENLMARHVVEVCLSYFADRLFEEGIDNVDIEYLSDDTGVSEDELKEVFNLLGYER